MPEKTPIQDPKPIGRPRKIKSAEELLERGEKYFADCRANNQPYLITGLALAVGLCSRQALIDYEAKPAFKDVVKRLKAVVERGYESRLYTGNPTGAIFALKNMGWSDRQDWTLSAPGGGPAELAISFVKPGEEEKAKKS